LSLFEKREIDNMTHLDGITHDGLKTALDIKENYKAHQPICMPGEETRMLLPENLMNTDIDLQSIEDPLALSMMASRDPEPPMALAAATRLGPMGKESPLINGVLQVVRESTKHPIISDCISLITESAFNPEIIRNVRGQANKYIVNSRREYTLALRKNLQALLDGLIAPRLFVCQFFELTEAGNMRSDIRKKLVLSILLSENIRPSIKFLFLENFNELPQPVRKEIVRGVMRAEPSHHMEIIKEELRWMTSKTTKNLDTIQPQGLPTEDITINRPISIEKTKGKPRPWHPGEKAINTTRKEVFWH